MAIRRYRIKTPTMATAATDGHRATVIVPADVIVSVPGDLPDGDRLIDVMWNDRSYLMFTRDLRERGEPLS
jgi:hypothetical protein